MIIEDSASLALGYSAQLSEAGYDATWVGNLAEAREAMHAAEFDAALLDLQLPDGDGLSLLENRPANAPSFIVVTADGSLNRAITAMRSGAFDFLVKPVGGTRLLSTVEAAVANKKRKVEVEPVKARSDAGTFHGFIGQSPPMRSIYRTIEQVADSRAAVFVTGESGTGKEVTAEAIHLSSRRNNKAFVAINCGAIPENLLESELFGHVKGAFTGAVENRIGAAKAADGGTLFLDELCEMELKLQVKLLRFLQTGTIQRVGSAQAEPVDVRIVCATNRDPMREVAEGRFREDLFYRLNVIPIHLPPLRERGEDVLLLAERLSERIAREEGREDLKLSARSKAIIQSDPWPGNIRELQNVLRRAVVTASGSSIEIERGYPGAAPTRVLPFQQPEQPAVNDDVSLMPPTWADMSLAEIERHAIEAAISRCSGNVTKAASHLKVSASTLYRKMERWRAA
ncbi:sigma-54-dependent Fis family transcriptional regulator [Erythrobacter litoralis]|nr:sigma-54-dependent Fis family transcriptional regulator [Erythrobacter litoralis]